MPIACCTQVNRLKGQAEDDKTSVFDLEVWQEKKG